MSITPYVYDLEPGATEFETLGEANYIFVDFADRPFELVINGEPITLRKGSRFRSRGGLFDKFQIRNLDPDSAIRVIMLVGTDEVDNQIVEGEISIVPILRSADGTTKTDTRSPLNIKVVPENLNTTAYLQGDKVGAQSYLIGGATVIGEHDANRPIVFAGPGGYPVFSWYYNSRADGGFYQVDWNLKKLFESTLNLVTALPITNSSMADNGWTPDHGYIGVLDRRVYRYTGIDDQDKAEIYYSGISQLASCCYVPLHNSILLQSFDGETIEEIDASTLQRKRLVSNTGIFQGKLRWDWSTNQLYTVGNDVRPINYDTLTMGGSIPLQPHYGTGAVIRGNNIFGTFGGGTDKVEAEKYALFDYVTKPEFVGIRPGCELAHAFLVPESVPQIKATIEVQELDTGIVLDGEVIKAALEYFFRREAPEDYLDHIYYADVGQDRFGVPIKPISTGNETFARAGIADDFAVKVPGTIALTIDNELTMGAPL